MLCPCLSTKRSCKLKNKLSPYVNLCTKKANKEEAFFSFQTWYNKSLEKGTKQDFNDEDSEPEKEEAKEDEENSVKESLSKSGSDDESSIKREDMGF